MHFHKNVKNSVFLDFLSCLTGTSTIACQRVIFVSENNYENRLSISFSHLLTSNANFEGHITLFKVFSIFFSFSFKKPTKDKILCVRYLSRIVEVPFDLTGNGQRHAENSKTKFALRINP